MKLSFVIKALTDFHKTHGDVEFGTIHTLEDGATHRGEMMVHGTGAVKHYANDVTPPEPGTELPPAPAPVRDQGKP